MYTIRPVFHGYFYDYDTVMFTFKANYRGIIEKVPLISYLIEGKDTCILVDTGPPKPEDAQHMTHIRVFEATCLDEELRRMGRDVKEVQAVILTHIHWDHSYNLEMFPDIPIYVQKRELHYAVSPLPCDRRHYGYNPQNGQPAWFTGFHQMRVLDGDAPIQQGITAVLSPGHTPGMQGVLVETKEGRYCIGSDTFPLFENYEKAIPSGIHVDLNEWFATYERTKTLCDFILPGHDIRVLDRSVYG